MKQQTFVAGFSGGGRSQGRRHRLFREDLPHAERDSQRELYALCPVPERPGRQRDGLYGGDHGDPAGSGARHQPLVYENHGIDARYTGPHTIAPTLSARAGTEATILPLVEQRDAAHGSPSEKDGILYARQRVDVFHDNDVASTESARQYKDATDLVCQQADSRRLIRRLTPLECERLQGFPDGWTALSDASDSARYRALGNSVAIPCVEFIMRGITIAVSY